MATITNVEPLFLRYKFPPSIHYEYTGGLVENQDVALVRVTCDTGEYGLGEITFGEYCYEPILGLIEHFKTLLVGRSAMEINGAWERMYGASVFWNRQGVGIGVMGGINLAMYDLVGKLLGVPGSSASPSTRCAWLPPTRLFRWWPRSRRMCRRWT